MEPTVMNSDKVQWQKSESTVIS